VTILHVLDASGLVHRAYHATAGRGPVAALVTMAQMLDRLEQAHQITRGVVVLDPPGRGWRHELFAEYKAGRPALDRELAAQLPRVAPLARALGWPAVMVPGYEADDAIATIVTRARGRGWQVRVHAADKDLLQLVGDGVRMVDPVRRVDFGPAEVESKLGVPPARVADYLAIAGDAGDNVPGVEGAGPKTAAELVRRYSDVEAVIAANPKVRGRYPLSTTAGIDALRLSRRLVDLAREAPVDLALEDMSIGRRDEQAVRAALAPPAAPEQLGLGLGARAAEPAPVSTARPAGAQRGASLGEMSSPVPAQLRDDFGERAGIMEYCGLMSRADAERAAYRQLGQVVRRG
jgi:5'-3' exonuclease